MKMRVAVLFVLVSIAGAGTLPAQGHQVNVAAELRGLNLKWLYAAEPEVVKRHMDLANYLVKIIERDETVTILFIADESSPGEVGSLAENLSLEVKIRKKDLKMLSAAYSK